MEKRPFGRPPSEKTVEKTEFKSELYTKIGTRVAIITAHYEHIQPTGSHPVTERVVTDTSCNTLKSAIKQVKVCESLPEVIYDVPRRKN